MPHYFRFIVSIILKVSFSNFKDLNEVNSTPAKCVGSEHLIF